MEWSEQKCNHFTTMCRTLLAAVAVGLVASGGCRAWQVPSVGQSQHAYEVLALSLADRIMTCDYVELTGTFLLEQLWQVRLARALARVSGWIADARC
jgi:hypothetical protein